MSRVYKDGVLIAVEVNGKENLINPDFFVYSFEGELTLIENLAINTRFELVTIQIEDKGGNLVGNEQDVDIYLKALIDDGSSPSVGLQGGFIDYNNTIGAVPLVADTWTDIPNDGAGLFTNKTYKPAGVTELIDTTTGYLSLGELVLGDSVFMRNDYTINPNTNNSLLEFRYQLGSGTGTYTLEKIIGRLDSGSNQNYRFSLTTDLIYMGDLNTKDNPIKLQVRLSTSGTLTNAGSVIQVTRR